jgi:hypothetical protein
VYRETKVKKKSEEIVTVVKCKERTAVSCRAAARLYHRCLRVERGEGKRLGKEKSGCDGKKRGSVLGGILVQGRWSQGWWRGNGGRLPLKFACQRHFDANGSFQLSSSYTACARYQRAFRTVVQWDQWLGATRKCEGYAVYTRVLGRFDEGHALEQGYLRYRYWGELVALLRYSTGLYTNATSSLL